MKAELPPATQTKFDAVLAKLLESLRASPEHLSARSEFVSAEGTMGGQVLSGQPQIEHPYPEIHALYAAMFEQAKNDGLELREFQIEFERKHAGGDWTYKSRFITVGEFKAIEESTKPTSEAIRVALRKIADGTAADWRSCVFDWNFNKRTQVLVLHGAKVRAITSPTPELAKLAGSIDQAAQSQGLVMLGGSWRVTSQMDDTEDEVEATLKVIRDWPTSDQ
jgi:hypothetical protein